MNRFALVLLSTAAVTAFAADLPSSPMAVQAKKSYEQQVKWADAQFDQDERQAKQKRDLAVKAAQADYEKALKKSMDVALAAKNVEEIKIIDEVLDGLKAGAADNPIPLGRYSGKFVNDRAEGSYELEWESKNGFVAETEFTPNGGPTVRHKTLTPRTPALVSGGDIKVALGEWGHDIWTPLAAGGFIVQRFERKTNSYHLGILKKVGSK